MQRTTIGRLGLCIPAALVLSTPCPTQSGQALAWRQMTDHLTMRGSTAMAYDPVRQRLVMFGGAVLSLELLNETWEWDGTSWRQILPATSPTPRVVHSMTYDPVRQTVILFGGNALTQTLHDMWEWDGRDWRQLHPALLPPPRSSAAMATDPVRKRVVLFGGDSTWTGGGELGDTWEWDGTRWTQMAPTNLPGARIHHRMAYCAKSGRVLLFGGVVAFGPLPTGTWEWDGRDWTLHTPAVEPPNRQRMGLCRDPGDGSVLLHGADMARGGGTTNETWVWDGTTWTSVVTSNDPPVRAGRVLGPVDHTGEVIQFGAPELSGVSSADVRTWAWKNRSWRVAEQRQAPESSFGWAYDQARDEIVMVGFRQQVGYSSTWLLRGTRFVHTWKHARAGIGMVYHAGIRKCVAANNQKTWLWDGTDWSEHTTGKPFPFSGVATNTAYDGHRGCIVHVRRNTYYGRSEVWEWTPTGGWEQRSSGSTGPTARSYYVLEYDARRRRTVLFGGRVSASQQFNDTWEWDGTQWTEHKPATRPLAQRHVGEYVPALGGVAVWTSTPDMYVWDGNDWRVIPGIVPHTRTPGAVPGLGTVYDTGHQRIHAIGTVAPGSGGPWMHWELSARPLSADQPYPRPGETVTLGLDLPSEAGQAWVMGLSLGGWPGVPLRPVPGLGVELLPLRDDPVLRASLSVPLQGVLDAQGQGALPLAIPANPWLLGIELHAAAATLRLPAAVGAITNRQPIWIRR